MDDLYSNRLLEAAASLPPAARLDAPSGQGRRTSKVCGSEVEVDLLLEDGVVRDHALRVKACALGQASSSLLSGLLNGSTAEELRALQPVMEKMLREGGPAPTGRFSSLDVLRPIAEYPARHASTLLVFGAVVDALDEAEARDAA
ncbi:iron-sulfur cluster assembly scaffold protein [Parvularcula lutaonensis]|uniref:Iron-sulfur cluster assembly scaffold protein n=1 Tax=Parvularcula lutaonensis TaxID=491923 RepID=A0ABV7MH03_9PROT|nr:iron-sulfur cluster assembly scaffold protein [Parvularcula lutaonensis]GGY53456.1 iron-sulfur cluster assembly scaffold protein [Parvularcula lutaonensis]